LYDRLGRSARVTVVSAPPGSGKTVLLRSWISDAGLAERAAWVPAGRDKRDPQLFWLSVLGALGQTSAGAQLVRPVTAAPDLDGWAIVERLLKDLAPLEERLWLVIDDVHELDSPEARRQLELLMMRGPPELRLVLATRHDVRLGLHRLRLEGELTEIRGPDLRFSLAEARQLLGAAGVKLPGPTLALLLERTEGWAAGLRLAALSLAGHPDPGRFAAEFSGTERTVAEYLLAEVLERQPAEARRLLLRTSVLDRINGELADLLTGGGGGDRILQDLEDANAFVMSLDAARSWFRYHHLFADLLQLELRRTEPGEITTLHELAAEWFAGHGFAVEAVRHAQAVRDWGLAARLLADHWPGLYLDGQAATVHELLAGFPAEGRAADPELAALAAADELAQGSLEAAERYLGLAERGAASAEAGRRGQAPILLGVVRLMLARHQGNLQAVTEQAERLQALAETPDAVRPGLGQELRGLVLVSLGIAEVWAGPARPSRTWSRASRWRAGSGGHIWSSPAWRARRSPSSTGRFRGRRSAVGRRSSWPSGGAGLMRRSPSSPTWRSEACWPGRGGWTRPGPGCSAPSAPSGRKPTLRRRWGSCTSAASSSWGAAGPPTRWPRSGPPSASSGRTRSPGRSGPGFCTPWCASATPSAPSICWPALANPSATAGRCAAPPRRCDSASTTRTRQPPRSRRSWTAPAPSSGRSG
jgi:hypothetical protein